MASELLMSTVQQEVAEDILEVYAEFVLDWCRRDGVDPSLVSVFAFFLVIAVWPASLCVWMLFSIRCPSVAIPL